MKIPFGIAQSGKSLSKRRLWADSLVFRQREFETDWKLHHFFNSSPAPNKSGREMERTRMKWHFVN